MRSGRPVLGGILLVVGLLLIAAGALGVAAFGPSGTISEKSPPLKTQPDGYALVVDVLGVNAGFPGSSLLGTPTLGADSTGPERMFVGVAPRDSVDEYLTGVAFEAVRQEGSQWPTESIPGTKKPPVPADETLWVDESTGNAPSIDFTPATSGSTFIVMNADATPGVAAQIVVGYTSPFVFPASIAAMVLGLLAIIQGFLFMRGRRSEDEPVQTPPVAPPPVAPPLVPVAATDDQAIPSAVAADAPAPSALPETPPATPPVADPRPLEDPPVHEDPEAPENPRGEPEESHVSQPEAQLESKSEAPPETDADGQSGQSGSGEPTATDDDVHDVVPDDWFRDGGDTR